MVWASRTVSTGGSMCDGGSWPVESVTTELLVQPASVQALRRRVCGVYTPRPEQRHKTWDSNKSGKRELFSKSDPPPIMCTGRLKFSNSDCAYWTGRRLSPWITWKQFYCHRTRQKKARESKITAGAGTDAELRYPERNWNLRVLSTARLHASEHGVESVAMQRSIASYHITPPPSPWPAMNETPHREDWYSIYTTYLMEEIIKKKIPSKYPTHFVLELVVVIQNVLLYKTHSSLWWSETMPKIVTGHKKVTFQCLGILLRWGLSKKGTSFVTYLHVICNWARRTEARAHKGKKNGSTLLTRDVLHEIISLCMDTPTITVRQAVIFNLAEEWRPLFSLICCRRPTGHYFLMTNTLFQTHILRNGGLFWMRTWWKETVSPHQSTYVPSHMITDCLRWWVLIGYNAMFPRQPSLCVSLTARLSLLKPAVRAEGTISWHCEWFPSQWIYLSWV